MGEYATWFALGMHLADIRVLKWVKMGNQPQNGSFWHLVVCCKDYEHCQRHETHPTSQKDKI